MEQFLQQLTNGLAVGGIYALIALGYTMVYGVLKLINFAHGDLFTIGAYLGLTLLTSALLGGNLHGGAGLLLLALMVMLLVGFIGIVLERVAYRPLRQSPRLSAVVSALGASIFLQNAVMLIYGAKIYVYPHDLLPAAPISVFGLSVPLMRIVILAASVIMMAALFLFVQKTRVGAAIRAAAIDQDAARLMGIDVNRVIMIVFCIGPALGGAAGLMVGLYYGQINFTMGWLYGLKAFTAAILGGPPASWANGWRRKYDMKRHANLICYLAFFALMAAMPLFLERYWVDVLNSVGLYLVLALSLNLILGDAGMFNMGHAAFYAVGAYTAAILNTRCGVPVLWTMPAAGLAAAAFALVAARPIIHLRGDYLLIVTIGLVEIARIALVNDVFGLTGGANGIFGIARPTIFGVKIAKPHHFFYLIWTFAAVTVLLFSLLADSRFGRARAGRACAARSSPPR